MSRYLSDMALVFRLLKALVSAVYAAGGSDEDLHRLVEDEKTRDAVVKAVLYNRPPLREVVYQYTEVKVQLSSWDEHCGNERCDREDENFSVRAGFHFRFSDGGRTVEVHQGTYDNTFIRDGRKYHLWMGFKK